jgi:hypothetical protein
MKFTKAQQEILDIIASGDELLNASCRMRAIQPLLDAGVIGRRIVYYGRGLGFYEEDQDMGAAYQYFIN